MANSRGVIEIRLDRRQAFYGFVGCMLIVSVVFVVGIIVGQRMEIPSPLEALALNETENEAVGLFDEVEAPEPDDFTFYDELSVNAPPSQLVFEAAREDAVVEPAMRALERQNPTVPPVESPEPQRVAAAEPQPVPAPPVQEPTPTPMVEPEPVVVDRGEDPSDSSTRTVQRRAVRQSAADDGPEEFGYFIVEVGRFASFDEADAQRLELQQAGHNAIVTLLGDNSQLRFRVQLGNFTRRSEAASTAGQVNGRVIQEG